MENNKQTAVDWLIDWMGENQYFIGNDLLQAFEKAKAMHKEEIADANFYGQRLHAKSVTNTMMEANAFAYYEETFGGNK